MAKLLEILKSTEIPEGYVVEITGHSNKHPKPSQRKGNKLSVERARLVYEFLVKNGIPKNKLSYRGVASDQYDARLGHDQNRRVTFRLVKVESAGGT
ncbi:MAG: OmpA family protein [Turneriella sp.]|nr:OmpA family protein [Turneriella sp.]